jgi:hypothetical protein
MAVSEPPRNSESEAPRNSQANIMLASLGLVLVIVSLAVLISHELRGVDDMRAVRILLSPYFAELSFACTPCLHSVRRGEASPGPIPQCAVMVYCRLQVWSARDAVNAVGCYPDAANDGKLVYATCALYNRSVFWDFAGLRRLQPSELTGVRLVRHAEVCGRTPGLDQHARARITPFVCAHASMSSDVSMARRLLGAFAHRLRSRGAGDAKGLQLLANMVARLRG